MLLIVDGLGALAVMTTSGVVVFGVMGMTLAAVLNSLGVRL